MKKAIAMLLALVMIVALCACGQQAEPTPAAPDAAQAAAPEAAPEESKTFDPSEMVIGYSCGETGTEFAIAMASATKEPLEAAGYTVLYSDAQGQQENQIAALRSYIAQDVDAIILYPVTTDGWDAVLEEVKEAEIPLIVFSRNVEPTAGKVTDYALCFVGPDNIYAGELCTQACVDYFKDAEGPINLVVLEGQVGVSATVERTTGIHNVIDNQDKIQIVASQTANFSRTDGKEVMEAIIKAKQAEGTKIDAVIGENDDMALGAVQALTEAGYKCGSEVWVGGVDGVYSAFESMVAGTYNCTVENPLQYGVEIERILKEYFADGKIPEEWVVLKNDIYYMDNAAEVIGTRTY